MLGGSERVHMSEWESCLLVGSAHERVGVIFKAQDKTLFVYLPIQQNAPTITFTYTFS
jgi:hypothetical protein